MKTITSISTLLLTVGLLASCSTVTMKNAAASGNLTQLNQLLESGKSIDERDSSANKTPLLQACRSNQAQAALFLINRGADVNAIDNEQWSAIHLAARYMNEPGALQTAQLMHAKGAHLETRTDKGVTPLMLAAYTNDTQLTKWLIDQGAQLNHVDSTGWNAMDFAYNNKSKQTADLLAAKGLKAKKTANPWAPASPANMDNKKIIFRENSSKYNEQFANRASDGYYYRVEQTYANGTTINFWNSNGNGAVCCMYTKTGPLTATLQQESGSRSAVIYYLRFTSSTEGYVYKKDTMYRAQEKTETKHIPFSIE